MRRRSVHSLAIWVVVLSLSGCLHDLEGEFIDQQQGLSVKLLSADPAHLRVQLHTKGAGWGRFTAIHGSYETCSDTTTVPRVLKRKEHMVEVDILRPTDDPSCDLVLTLQRGKEGETGRGLTELLFDLEGERVVMVEFVPIAPPYSDAFTRHLLPFSGRLHRVLRASNAIPKVIPRPMKEPPRVPYAGGILVFDQEGEVLSALPERLFASSWSDLNTVIIIAHETTGAVVGKTRKGRSITIDAPYVLLHFIDTRGGQVRYVGTARIDADRSQEPHPTSRGSKSYALPVAQAVEFIRSSVAR